MDNDVRAHPKEQSGKPLGAELEKHGLDLRGKSVAEITSILTSPTIVCEDGIDEALLHTSHVEGPFPPAATEPFSLTNAPSIIPRVANAPPVAPGIKPLKPVPFK